MTTKYVLITGASSGLGKETAIKLANDGYIVFAGIRKENDANTLNKIHTNIRALILDVTSEESVNKAFEVIKETTNNLFALVNNAGIATGGPVEFIPIETLQNQFNVNVFGAIRVAQKFLRIADKNEARIINISSMSSYGIFPFVSPYCASKRALDMFFNSLILENKHKNLKIVSIKPGVVATPIWNKSIDACEKCFENATQECYETYEKEMRFLADNARKNTNKGLKSTAIANLVSKVLKIKNPKLSYNIGKDSKFARLMSFLPLKLSNSLVKFGLKKRLS